MPAGADHRLAAVESSPTTAVQSLQHQAINHHHHHSSSFTTITTTSHVSHTNKPTRLPTILCTTLFYLPHPIHSSRTQRSRADHCGRNPGKLQHLRRSLLCVRYTTSSFSPPPGLGQLSRIFIQLEPISVLLAPLDEGFPPTLALMKPPALSWIIAPCRTQWVRVLIALYSLPSHYILWQGLYVRKCADSRRPSLRPCPQHGETHSPHRDRQTAGFGEIKALWLI